MVNEAAHKVVRTREVVLCLAGMAAYWFLLKKIELPVNLLARFVLLSFHPRGHHRRLGGDSPIRKPTPPVFTAPLGGIDRNDGRRRHCVGVRFRCRAPLL